MKNKGLIHPLQRFFNDKNKLILNLNTFNKLPFKSKIANHRKSTILTLKAGNESKPNVYMPGSRRLMWCACHDNFWKPKTSLRHPPLKKWLFDIFLLFFRLKLKSTATKNITLIICIEIILD